MKMKKHIIVNGDDFGMSSSVNQAIFESFNNGWISTTTLMSNMPGFEEACDMAHSNKLTNRIGAHLNLTIGKPLTQKISGFSKICDRSGNFCFNPYEGNLLRQEEKKAIFEEFALQINRCLNAGIKPIHIDSHQHVHNFWDIGSTVIKIAKLFDIRAVRLAHNYGRSISRIRKIYALIFNNRMKLSGLARTNIFCDILDVTPKLLNFDRLIEIMVHPRLNENGQITNRENGNDLYYLIHKLIPKEKFVTYEFLLR